MRLISAGSQVRILSGPLLSETRNTVSETTRSGTEGNTGEIRQDQGETLLPGNSGRHGAERHDKSRLRLSTFEERIPLQGFTSLFFDIYTQGSKTTSKSWDSLKVSSFCI